MNATALAIRERAVRAYADQQRKRRHWHVDERRFLESLPLVRKQQYHTEIYTRDTGRDGANAAALRIARRVERDHFVDGMERKRRGYGRWLVLRWTGLGTIHPEIVAATVVEKRLCHNPACVGMPAESV